MITEDYVSFETAKLLKEKGYWNIATTLYKENGDIVNYNIPLNNKGFSSTLGVFYEAPTLQTAMKWLREEHKLHIVVLWDCGAYTGSNSFYYHIDRIDNYEDKGYNKVGFDSYEQACEAAIKYCLENLI